MSRFQILSLIGGGIRGAFVTSYLKELEDKLGSPIAECFDLIAGTSTGAIIAAGLASGMPAAKMHDFYVRYGAKIFTPREKYKAKGAYRFLFPIGDFFFRRGTGGDLAAAFRARFLPTALEESFAEGFGEKTMKDVNFTRLIMPAVNLTKGKPHVFRSRHLPKAIHDSDIKIADAIIASTAAPTYFPHRQIGENSYVDGGMWAADPSMLAVAEALRINELTDVSHPEEHFKTSDLHLLSVGTGRSRFAMEPPDDRAGLLYWAPRVADVMGTSQAQGIHLPLKFFLGNRYRHVNFRMTEKWGLDEVENIPKLFAVGETRAAETFDEINERFFQHKRIPFKPFLTDEHEIHLDDFGFE